MDNSIATVVAPERIIKPLEVLVGALAVKKDYKNGGGSVKWRTKADFKKEYLLSHPTASSRDISNAFNDRCKRDGEIARRNAVAFFSNPEILVNGARSNKDGSKGAVNFCTKSSIKAPKDNRKKTVTPDQAKESIKGFTRADREMLIQELLESLQA